MVQTLSRIGLGMVMLLVMMQSAYAQQDNLGQTIQIYTQLNSFVGRPSWLLMIRDIDHDQNIPYVYDFTREDNFWLAFTFGRNYFIQASTLQFSPYRANPYRTKVINDFCHLESRGRVMRGESIYVMIKGDLTPNTDTYECYVTHYSDTNFTIYNPDES